MTGFTSEQKTAIAKALTYKTGWMTDEVKTNISKLLECEKLDMDDTNRITGLVFDLIYTRDKSTGRFKHSWLEMGRKSSELYKLLRKYPKFIV